MQKIEILAPAGDWESLVGAINAGANAVYLAGKQFGARKSAHNFDNDELVKAIEYAHLRDVRVFVTINTLIFEEEWPDLMEYSDYLVEHFVDALIVQDFGVLSVFTKRYPNTDIHVSTQANTHSLEQVQWLASIGVKRIVLARETDLDFIRLVKQNVEIEIEVFVHGALCVSYSGNCLHSSMIGKRSGNRGECAQSCRLPYRLIKGNQEVGESGYLLSTKDLMTIEHLDQLLSTGVDSLKIEGRMRKPEYVIHTTKSYRDAVTQIKNQQPVLHVDQTIDEMKRLFNRDFTKGYLHQIQPSSINQAYRPNHRGIQSGVVKHYKQGKIQVLLETSLRVGDGVRFLNNDDYGMVVSRILRLNEPVVQAEPGDLVILDVARTVRVDSIMMKTLDIELETSLQAYLSTNYPLIAVQIHVVANVHQPLQITIRDETTQVISPSDYVIPQARSQGVTKEQIKLQVEKLGDTPFYSSETLVETDGLGFIPLSVLNQTRRDALKLFEKKKLEREKRLIQPSPRVSLPKQVDQPYLVVKVETREQLIALLKYPEVVIYIEESVDYQNLTLTNRDIWLARKRIFSSQNQRLSTNKMVVHEIANPWKKPNLRWVSDQFFNVTNSISTAFLQTLGAERVVVSSECSKQRIQQLIEGYRSQFQCLPPLEMIVYGRLDLMLTKYCPITKHAGKGVSHCRLCYQDQYYLEDRIGVKFPLKDDGNCNLRMLHAKPLNLIKEINELKKIGIQTFRLDFTIESVEEVERIMNQIYPREEQVDKSEYEHQYTLGRYRQ